MADQRTHLHYECGSRERVGLGNVLVSLADSNGDSGSCVGIVLIKVGDLPMLNLS